MQKLIEKMRVDWPIVAEDRRQCGQWTEADEAEVGEAVKAAIASKNQEMILCWARWLGDLAATSVAMKAVSVALGLRMREAARKQREEKAAQ